MDVELDNVLRRDGFVVLRRFLPEADIAALESEMARLLAIEDTQMGHFVVRDAAGDPLVANGLDRVSDTLFDFARRPEMIHAACDLIGQQCIPLHVEYFEKPPNTTSQSPPHQDHVFYRDHFDDLAVALWIAFDAVDGANGGLHYADEIPDRLLPHRPSVTPDFDSELVDPSGFRFRPVSLSRGDCVAHHSLAVHCSSANLTGRRRRAIAFNYRASPYRDWLSKRGRAVSSTR